jgi:hypothetical protein
MVFETQPMTTQEKIAQALLQAIPPLREVGLDARIMPVDDIGSSSAPHVAKGLEWVYYGLSDGVGVRAYIRRLGSTRYDKQDKGCPPVWRVAQRMRVVIMGYDSNLAPVQILDRAVRSISHHADIVQTLTEWDLLNDEQRGDGYLSPKTLYLGIDFDTYAYGNNEACLQIGCVPDCFIITR